TVQSATTRIAAEPSQTQGAPPQSPPNAPPAPPPPYTWFPTAAPGAASATPQSSASQGVTPGPGEVLAIVLLKYADVSEIIGLLSGNDSVKPNDTFTPQEPNFGSSGLQFYY